MLPDLVDNLRSLIASQYAEADCPSVDVEISFFVADWKALSEPSVAARPARCVLVGMRRRCCMARSNQHLQMAA